MRLLLDEQMVLGSPGLGVSRGQLQRIILRMQSNFWIIWSHHPNQHAVAETRLFRGVRLVLTGTVRRSLDALGLLCGEGRGFIWHSILNLLWF